MFRPTNPEVYNRPATKYEIMQYHLKEEKPPKQSEGCLIPLKSYSNEAAISSGHYSFESDGIEDLTTVKKDNPYEIHHVEEVEEPEESVREDAHGGNEPEINVVEEYQQRRKP